MKDVVKLFFRVVDATCRCEPIPNIVCIEALIKKINASNTRKLIFLLVQRWRNNLSPLPSEFVKLRKLLGRIILPLILFWNAKLLIFLYSINLLISLQLICITKRYHKEKICQLFIKYSVYTKNN